MKTDFSAETEPPLPNKPVRAEQVLSVFSWTLAIGLVLVALYLGWRQFSGHSGRVSLPWIDRENSSSAREGSSSSLIRSQGGGSLGAAGIMPEFELAGETQAITRHSMLQTIIPSRPRYTVTEYSVQKGDSVFEIANKFKITPESVLWGNYEQLNDNPHLISEGMSLLIPPVDGVLYRWQEGDSIEAVAAQFKTTPQEIINWPGNNLDLVEPQIESGEMIMLPGGQCEFRQWLIPTIARGSVGVAASVYGAGACEGGYEGAYGTGTFIWPADNHFLSGNDYWSGHLAIDIAAGDGYQIYASDSGVVVFAGWANGGYGNTVIIDHGNGYQTLYAHLNSVSVRCGQSVSQGRSVGLAGTTGNSTGTHLHFEIRYLGGFINPWYELPAP